MSFNLATRHKNAAAAAAAAAVRMQIADPQHTGEIPLLLPQIST
jgi:hypothetical protein